MNEVLFKEREREKTIMNTGLRFYRASFSDVIGDGEPFKSGLLRLIASINK